MIVGDCSAMSNDSLRLKISFPEVIKEERKLDVKGKQFIPISVINDSLLLQLRPQQVDEVLSTLPGLYIQNYGGFGGMKSVSIRGTSSSQSVMMIEGIRLNSSQNGMIDVSTIPVSFLQSIEVTRTGSTALYGANAIGGAINFRLGNLMAQKPSLNINKSSFETYTASSTFGFTNKDFTTNVSINGIKSRGNYPFLHNEFGTTSTKQRDNGDFNQFSGVLTTTYSPSSTSSITTLFMASTTDRGVPGAVVQGSVEFKNARLKENDYFLSIIGKNSFTSSFHNDTKLWFKNNTLLYTDPDATLFGTDGMSASYNNKDIGLQSNFTYDFENRTLIESQIELLSTTLEGFSLEDGEIVTPLRNTFSVSTNLTSPQIHFLTLPFQFFTGIRYDHISDQNNSLSPMISFKISINDYLQFRSSYSYNFRPPSFNEMYYLNYGNQNLTSERSHSTTVGVDATVSSLFTASADLFSIRTSNLIVSIPTSPVSWSAQNIGSAENIGLELATKFSLLENYLSITSNLTLQNVVDKSENSFTYNLRVPYTPNVLFSAQFLSTFENLSSGITYTSSGNRFSLHGNQTESLLPFFHTLSVFTEYSIRLFPLLIHNRIQVDNLFNHSYTVIRNFPVPGRSFRLNIGVVWL